MVDKNLDCLTATSVCFDHLCGLNSDISRGPRRADSVEEVRERNGIADVANSNRLAFLGQLMVGDRYQFGQLPKVLADFVETSSTESALSGCFPTTAILEPSGAKRTCLRRNFRPTCGR
jgi:hypothetical protein